LRVECSQEALAHSDAVVATLTEELRTLREQLDNRTSLGKSQLHEEIRQTKAAAAHLQAQLDQVGRKASQLEQQLSERGAECREMASLCREVEELRTLTRSQEQKVAQSHREAEQSQAELASMEAILTLLHQQEVGKLLNSHPHSYVISHYMIYFSVNYCIKT
ncbi:hypothetical protein XENOCAPTIV_024643, partial [Xenoophorus captivus]